MAEGDKNMTHYLIGMNGYIDDYTDCVRYDHHIDSIYRDGCTIEGCSTISELVKEISYGYTVMELDEEDERYKELKRMNVLHEGHYY